MPDKKKTLVPRLRFPEFRDSGEWEVKRLGNDGITKFSGERVAWNDIPFGHYVSTVNLLPDFAGLSPDPEKPPKGSMIAYHEGDILISNIRPYLRKIWVANKVGGASNDVLVLRPGKGVVHSFLAHLLKSDRFVNYIMASVKGLKMPRGDREQILHFPIPLPQQHEQQKIADCLTSLDELIELQAKRLDALKRHKKGLLQQLFPREGETTPRLRFPEFRDAGEWGVKKLRELSRERTERGGEDLELLSVTISDGVMRASDLERKNNASTDLTNYKRVYPGDIVYNSMRMWQGASGVSRWHGIVSPAYTVVTMTEKQNPVFWSYHFKLSHSVEKFARFSQGVTSDTWNLKYPAFSAIEMAFPADPEEQQKIANCLSSLDELIELQAKRLDALKAHKKGLLQQLFPQEVE